MHLPRRPSIKRKCSQAASNTATSVAPSPILSSGLSGDIVAQNILPFLDRDSRLQVLAVTVLLQHFRLADFYCPEHGTTLQANLIIGGCGGEEAGGDPPDVEANADPGVGEDTPTTTTETNNPSESKENELRDIKGGPSNLQCVDCLEAQRGWLRCRNCIAFKQEGVHIGICDCCHEPTQCLQCSGQTGRNYGRCDACNKWFCGQNGCPTVQYSADVEDILAFVCSNCQKFQPSNWRTCKKRLWCFLSGIACHVMLFLGFSIVVLMMRHFSGMKDE